MTVEAIYDQYVKTLEANDRLKLVEKIVQNLQVTETIAKDKPTWASIRGIAPNLLDGEDAQAWVTRTRREADERRETAIRRQP